MDPRMPDRERRHTDAPSRSAIQSTGGLESLESGSKGDSWREIATKPVTIVAAVLGLVVVFIVILLQQDPGSLTLAVPEARYELLPNEGRTAGVPIAIRLGPLTVFEISDPLAGGGGAARARQVVENLNLAVNQLAESPGRVITIETAGVDGLPTIVQKEYSDSTESHQIVQLSSDDLSLAETENAKLLARVWAERLTDSIRFLLFGSPPEFSRDTYFGGALDTLYVNATSEGGPLTTDAINTAFEELPDDQREALTSFPALPTPAESELSPLTGDMQESG